jgi:hypothetical protein
MFAVEISDYSGQVRREEAESLDYARGIAEDCFGAESCCNGVIIYNDDDEIVEMYDEDGNLVE